MAKPLQESASESYVVSMSVVDKALDDAITFLAVVKARSQGAAERTGSVLELQWLGEVLDMGSGRFAPAVPDAKGFRVSLESDGFVAGDLTVLPYSVLSKGTVRL